MDASNGSRIDGARFELRYRSLSPFRCGYAFPCDAQGNVDLDQLSKRARANYLHALRVVGFELQQPQVSLAL